MVEKQENESESRWKTNYLNQCDTQWKTNLIKKVETEEVAKLISESKERWRAAFLFDTEDDEVWKQLLIANSRSKVLAEAIKNNDEEWKAQLLAGISEEEECWKVEMIMALPDVNWMVETMCQIKEEDKARLFHQSDTVWKKRMMAACLEEDTWKWLSISKCEYEWQGNAVLNTKSQVVPAADTEHRAYTVSNCKFQGVGLFLDKIDEDWKVGPVVESSEPWRAEVVMKCKEEWQARLVIKCQSKSMERWRVEKIPEIEDENVAVQYLFNLEAAGWSKPPRWKFELCIKIIQKKDEIWPNKIEKLFSRTEFGNPVPRWKAKMIDENIKDNELWKLEMLSQAKSPGIAEQVMRCQEELRGKMVAACGMIWCATMVADCQDHWRAELLCHPKMIRWRAEMIMKADSEWKAGLLARCAEQWRGQLILEARESWKMSLIVGDSNKISQGMLNDQWRYKLFAKAETEWKAIAISRVNEQWRAEIISRVAEEWKVAILLSGCYDKWRIELIEGLKKEWQIFMVLKATEAWKATLIAQLKSDQEKKGRKLMECLDEESARAILEGSSSHLYQ